MGFLEKRREAKEEKEINKTQKEKDMEENYKKFLDERDIPLRLFIPFDPKKPQIAQVKINTFFSNIGVLHPGFSGISVDDKGIYFYNEVLKKGVSRKDLKKELQEKFGFSSNMKDKSSKDLEVYLDELSHPESKLDKKYDKYYKIERNPNSAIQYAINFNKEDVDETQKALQFGAIGKLEQVIFSHRRVFLIMADDNEKDARKNPFIAIGFKHKEDRLLFIKTLRSILNDRKDIIFRVNSEDKAEAKKMKKEMRN